MNDRPTMVFGVDVGSVRRPGGFAWTSADASVHGEDDPSVLGDEIVRVLDAGGLVALAFEGPLSLPVPAVRDGAWRHLGQARAGEGNRPWSAGAGAGSLATGLAQLSWVLAYVREHSRTRPHATTRRERFSAGPSNVLLAEAMVTRDGKPEPVDGWQDHADALASARRLAEILSEPDAGGADVDCSPHRPLNLAATAALHAGLSVDLDELHQDVLVAKVRPASDTSVDGSTS